MYNICFFQDWEDGLRIGGQWISRSTIHVVTDETQFTLNRTVNSQITDSVFCTSPCISRSSFS